MSDTAYALIGVCIGFVCGWLLFCVGLFSPYWISLFVDRK